MQELTISLRENVLKISTVEKGEFKGVSATLAKDVVNDYKILNEEEFRKALKDLIGNITSKNPRSLSLNFIVEPQDVILKFITLNKSNGVLEDQLIAEIKDKVKDVPLEDMYFNHSKIAPFVYQFVGVRRDVLDGLMDISNKLEMQLRSVLPWILFLPKFVNINEPAIFISKVSGNQVVALSEFNGVFFSGVYEQEQSTDSLQKLVQDLSIYKRSEPISKVYIHNYAGFSLNPEYEVLDLEIPNSDTEEAKGYEMHLLVDHMMAQDQDLIYSKLNLLAALPVPAIPEKSNKMIVYAGVTAGLLLLLGGVGGIIYVNRPPAEVVENTVQTEVLSDTSDASTEKIEPVEEIVEEVVLNKEDVTIRVENGAGISGVAGKTQTFLEDAGYVIDSIDNADETGRTTTLIQIKESKANYQELLKEDMAETFEVEVTTDLDEASEYDILVIVGTDAQI